MEPKGEWEVQRRPGATIAVTFRGTVDEQTGREAAFRFLELAQTDEVHIHFDVRDVVGYSNKARKKWQAAIWPRRRQILSITVVSRSQLTRMGALMFGAFLGLPCRVVSDTHQ